MPAAAAVLALEFEVLIGRASRQGRLPIDELLDPFTALMAAHEPALADPRRVELTALVQALRALPVGLASATRLMLVPNLSAFTYAAVPGGLFRCGRLPDGVLLGEAPAGLGSLCDWAASLCLVAHEMRKAWQLTVASRADGLPRTASLSQLAFDLGHDEQSLSQAIGDSRGELLALLHGSGALPEVRLHASLDPTSRARSAEKHGQRVVRAVAELGLLDRPMHVWLGDEVLTRCLSPYSRELRQALWRWAQGHPEALGRDLQPLPATPSEDLLYAVVQDFLPTDPRLEAEKGLAERTVGIYHETLGDAGFEVIDLGRVDPHVCDARLPPWKLRQPAPVVLRLGNLGQDTAVEALRAVLEAMGGRVGSITVAASGQTLGGVGTVVLPRLLVRWAGGDKLPLPVEAGLGVNDFVGLSDRAAQTGAVVAVPSMRLSSAEALAAQYQSAQVTCLQLGDAALAQLIHEALWAQQLPESCEISWVVVGSAQTDGRPTLATLRALSAVAVARLRRIVVPASAPLQPLPPGAGATLTGIEPRRSTAWALRIKA